jgi:DNA-directed RNA polymerase specialized sigma24 family protein
MDGPRDLTTVRALEDSEEAPTSGVASSFESFFEAHHARLFGALAVMARNRADAEEIMQDAFLKVLERWDRVSAWTIRPGTCTGSR